MSQILYTARKSVDGVLQYARYSDNNTIVFDADTSFVKNALVVEETNIAEIATVLSGQNYDIVKITSRNVSEVEIIPKEDTVVIAIAQANYKHFLVTTSEETDYPVLTPISYGTPFSGTTTDLDIMKTGTKLTSKTLWSARESVDKELDDHNLREFLYHMGITHIKYIGYTYELYSTVAGEVSNKPSMETLVNT